MTKEQIDIIETASKIFVAWSMTSMTGNKFSKEEKTEAENKCFGYAVVTKRLDACGIDIVINPMLGILIDWCAESNPAKSLMILSDLLEKLPKPIPKGYAISPLDFSKTYPDKFPIASVYPDIETHFNHKWDEQKVSRASNSYCSDNSYDYKEYWTNLVNGEK